jgi:hypothetical protein
MLPAGMAKSVNSWTSSMRIILKSLFIAQALVAVVTGIEPAQLQETSETSPIIEVRLVPPANPLPEVSAEIQSLEKARDALEQEKTAKLDAAYNAALENAKSRISAAVGSALQLLDASPASGARHPSFLELRSKAVRASAGQGPNVRVKVLSVPPPDASIKSKLDAMEAKRADVEAQMLDQAIQEMGELTDVVVNELKGSLQLQMSALLIPAVAGAVPKTHPPTLLETTERDVPGMPAPEGLPKQLNVRVGASDVPYPTVAGVAQDMETRRDTAEHLLRQKVLELELKLLEAENEFVKDALHRAVGSVLVRFGT